MARGARPRSGSKEYMAAAPMAAPPRKDMVRSMKWSPPMGPIGHMSPIGPMALLVPIRRRRAGAGRHALGRHDDNSPLRPHDRFGQVVERVGAAGARHPLVGVQQQDAHAAATGRAGDLLEIV